MGSVGELGARRLRVFQHDSHVNNTRVLILDSAELSSSSWCFWSSDTHFNNELYEDSADFRKQREREREREREGLKQPQHFSSGWWISSPVLLLLLLLLLLPPQRAAEQAGHFYRPLVFIPSTLWMWTTSLPWSSQEMLVFHFMLVSYRQGYDSWYTVFVVIGHKSDENTQINSELIHVTWQGTLSTAGADGYFNSFACFGA